MLKLILLSVFLVACQARFNTEYDRHWEVFKTKYGKLYAKEEEMLRRATWENNLKYIQKHNLEADMGFHTFTLGINEYADWTSAEFVTYLKGYIQRNTTQHGSYFMAPENFNLPTTVDWRQHGYVTGVKNQKQCGSCWAFSTTGSLEGQHFKKTGKLVSLSEQNLVDCSKKQGNMGCQGGLMDQGFEYIKVNNGIDTEESYPYEAKNGKCRFKRENVGATCTGHVDIPGGDEDALQKAVATVGPISVAIDAGHPSFQMYKRGVYYERKCSSKALDHGVLAVGYGSSNGNDYWLVKNSWGATWGMEGYIQMSRNHDNNCGIATQASYPLV